jgi:hypothetical protein
MYLDTDPGDRETMSNQPRKSSLVLKNFFLSQLERERERKRAKRERECSSACIISMMRDPCHREYCFLGDKKSRT